MVQWEGLTFLLSLLTLLITLIYIYFQDIKKTRALQNFFASLTHELKTPLASMRLNAEVLEELIEGVEFSKYTQRLKQDALRLENELDKSLHLSRLEKGGLLNLTSIDLISFIDHQFKRYSHIPYTIEGESSEFNIMADEYALSIMMRNLIDNSLRHNKELKNIVIKLSQNHDKIFMSYNDQGEAFSGNIKNLGKLFYKHSSPKGSGIGLYLIKKLSSKMKAKFTIHHEKNLIFSFEFTKAK